MWALERRATLQASTCAIVWFPPRPAQRYTVAVFKGEEGEAAARRILGELEQHAVPNVGPDPWNAPVA